MKLYLINLSDHDGDVSYCFIEKDCWDYIYQAGPTFPKENFIHELPPKSIRDRVKLTGDEELDSNGDVTFFVTSGSWENDRALAVPYYHECYTSADFIQYCKDNDIEIVKECNMLMY